MDLVRWIPLATLLLVSAVSAGAGSASAIKRGAVWHQQAIEIEAASHRLQKPAERHKLLGRAEQANRRAMTWARTACRECCAADRDAALRFYRGVSDVAWRLKRARSKFRASTDREAQPIARSAPNRAVVRQVVRRNQLQRMRRAASETPANDVRSARRAELDRWRRARVAQRLGAAGRSPRAACR